MFAGRANASNDHIRPAGHVLETHCLKGTNLALQLWHNQNVGKRANCRVRTLLTRNKKKDIYTKRNLARYVLYLIIFIVWPVGHHHDDHHHVRQQK